MLSKMSCLRNPQTEMEYIIKRTLRERSEVNVKLAIGGFTISLLLQFYNTICVILILFLFVIFPFLKIAVNHLFLQN